MPQMSPMYWLILMFYFIIMFILMITYMYFTIIHGKNKYKKNWLSTMTNLFSSFDPSTGIMSMNWVSSTLFLIFFPFMYWYIPSQNIIFLLMIIKYLNKEFNMLIGSKSIGSSLIFMSMFIYIFYNNFIGLMPYVFTSSSHLVFTMSLALPMWVSFMLYGWINNMNHMFCHLVPMGTPFILMPFMVFIETISNIIRPGSLAVRLSANMIAGHLLMTLLGDSSNEVIYEKSSISYSSKKYLTYMYTNKAMENMTKMYDSNKYNMAYKPSNHMMKYLQKNMKKTVLVYTKKMGFMK